MRSKLFVPGSRPELFAKALAGDATRDVVVPSLMVSWNCALAVPLRASVTVTVMAVGGSATVGVPVIAPVAVLNDSPAGSPGKTEYVNGAVPPPPCTGTKLVTGTRIASVVDGMSAVAVSGPTTVRAVGVVPEVPVLAGVAEEMMPVV